MADQITKSELFISAQQAMWAGDYDRCFHLLIAASAPDSANSDVRRPRRGENPLADAEPDGPPIIASDEFVEYSDPLTLMTWRAVALLDSLTRAELPPPPMEFIVQTRHLRGVFHQISARCFELRAFLLDWSWQRELFRRTRVISEAYHKTSARHARSARRPDEPAATLEFYDDPSSTWTIVEPQMLLEATISDFGLVVVTGTWIDRAEPSGAEPIHSAFRRVLEAIENNGIDAA